MGWLRKLGAVLIGALCVLSPVASAKKKFVPTNPCDDGMGRLPVINGTLNDGSGLRRVWRVRNDTAELPKNVQWVDQAMTRLLLKNQWHIDKALSWPRDAPPRTNCTLSKVTYNKLCVSPRKRGFRTKVRLWTKCGTMLVRYRVALNRKKKPVLVMWGRTRT